MNPASWGPVYWRFLHYFSIHYENDSTYIKTVKSLIPCTTCQSEWIEPELHANMILWSLELHNKVNTKLGKYDKWTLIDYHIANKEDCDICNSKSNNFPWLFIHMIAEQNSVDSLLFLQEFNKKYPCETCKYTFFLDEPQQDESVLDWTIRHHKRHDSLFEYKKPKPCACCPERII